MFTRIDFFEFIILKEELNGLRIGLTVDKI